MDFKDEIKQLGEKVCKNKELVRTEEATKIAFIMPFLRALGYDTTNPSEVVPEYTCDIGTKQGEKIDCAIFKDGEPLILIECKHWGQNLNLHDNQLLRYFHVSKAKFAILTNGIEYLFYSDLAEPNKMDEKPFLELNMEDIKDNVIEEVKKFHKSYIDVDALSCTASELKYVKELKSVINSEMNNPSADFVRVLTKQVYSGIINQKQLDIFTSLIKRTFSQTINEIISDRLKSALNTEKPAQETQVAPDSASTSIDSGNGIVTTEEELEGFRIVKAILRKQISADRVFYRDTQSYFNILLDDSIRKIVCRLYFNNPAKKFIALFGQDSKENKIEIKTLDDIYLHSDALIQTALWHNSRFGKDKGGSQEASNVAEVKQEA
ncbi:MAG: type I restriction endonuclease [Fibromonadales bacterium]|nr:type I restriction endonuclease [Fibromonadales bacterium]